jgi:hypothetical protein
MQELGDLPVWGYAGVYTWHEVDDDGRQQNNYVT